MDFGETPRRSVGLQVAPLADIIFQLLIFFMLVTVIKQSAEYVQDLPRATEGKDVLGKTGQITVNITEKGEIIVGETVHQIPTLQGYLQRLGEPSLLSVYLRGDKEVDWDEVREVIKACAEIGISDIAFGVYKKEMEDVSR